MPMKAVRIIPRLDIKGPNLVKGIHLEGLRVLGKPEDFALQYYRDGADEIIYMDVVASLYGRNNLVEIVERTAKNISIPLTVGGGIRNLDDIKNILRVGADKVAINTAAINNSSLITQGANSFGSQCIVVSIEAKRKENGDYEAYTDNGREKTGVDIFEWAKEVEDLGAGEILLTSIDKEGTEKGYDIELIRKVSRSVSIPVIAHGGAGRKEHILEVIREGIADAVAVASLLHYKRLERIVDQGRYAEEGNIEFLKKVTNREGYLKRRINPTGISQLKAFLNYSGIPTRAYNQKKQTLDEKNLLFPKTKNKPTVVIVDYGLGNLFSIARAIKNVGGNAEISSDPEKIIAANRLILPGVGAFGDGIKGLRERNLIEPIKVYAASGKPLLGICLGMQLLMSESEEFGLHKGLNLIEGKVIRFQEPNKKTFKIPHVGWNKLIPYTNRKPIKASDKTKSWRGTVLENINEGTYVYFVHSYFVIPDNPLHITAVTEYGNDLSCSVVSKKNIFGCQFHPELSGEVGLDIYRQFLFGKK